LKFKKTDAIAVALILAIFAVSAYFYPQMPDKVASHWNAEGLANGYTSRFWGLFLMPFIVVGVYLLLVIVPRIDPKKRNIAQFRQLYDLFLIVFLAFMLYLHLLTIAWNLGYQFGMNQALVPAFSALFYVMGILIGKAKHNYTIGIRTPWTLASEEVWNSTHRVGGKIIRFCAVITLLGVFFPGQAIWFLLAPVLAAAAFLTVYSYLEYRKVAG
jgi:uncharacterized membrane protein